MADCHHVVGLPHSHNDTVGGVSLQQTKQGGEESQAPLLQSSQLLWAGNHGNHAEQLFPYSTHDNRTSLLNSIHLFDRGLGRRKCVDNRRQHNSNFCLCHMGVARAVGGSFATAHQSDFLPKQDIEATQSRRFPRSHQERSSMAAAELRQQGPFLWFGRHDATHTHTPLCMLAVVTDPSKSQPLRPRHKKP